MKNKKVVANFPLRLTKEIKELLDLISERDRRTKQGEIFWLIESYAKGVLIEHKN